MYFSLGNLKLSKNTTFTFVSIFLIIGFLFFIIKKRWYTESFISSENKVKVTDILNDTNMSYFEKIGKINTSIVNDDKLKDITYGGLKEILLNIDEYIKNNKSKEFNKINDALLMKDVSFYNKVQQIKDLNKRSMQNVLLIDKFYQVEVINKQDILNNIILDGEKNIIKEVEAYSRQ
jgi:hypothetical protein